MSQTIATSLLQPAAATNSSRDHLPSLRRFAELGLSAEQRTKIRGILASAKAEHLSEAQVHQRIETVLTAAQRAMLSGAHPGAAVQPPPKGTLFDNLGLTADQKQKLHRIIAAAKAHDQDFADVRGQIEAILTPAQRAQLAKNAPPTAGPDPDRAA